MVRRRGPAAAGAGRPGHQGLEFDGVVIAEPGGIVGESEAGWRTLYVVLTRRRSG
jgi:hypothetical protein